MRAPVLGTSFFLSVKLAFGARPPDLAEGAENGWNNRALRVTDGPGTMDRNAMTLVVLLAAAASSCLAQSQAPIPATRGGPGPDAVSKTRDASAIVLAPGPAANPAAPAEAPEGPVHAVSPRVAAAISSVMPPFGAGPAAPGAASPTQDLREVDKPKNTIPRLPVEVMARYLVTESRTPVFRIRDLYTAEGRTALSFAAHPGLHIGNFFGLNSGLAYEMYLEEERVQNIADLKDTAYAVAVGGDPEEAQAILDATRDAFIRTEDNDGPVRLK